MLSDNQLKNLGFKRLKSEVENKQAWLFDHEDTFLILTNELGTGIYSLERGGTEYWRGALVKPISLIKKLIQFGKNNPQ